MLRECPFCGNEDIDVSVTCFGWEYVCGACGLHARFQEVLRIDPNYWAMMNVAREDSDKRWNKRIES